MREIKFRMREIKFRAFAGRQMGEVKYYGSDFCEVRWGKDKEACNVATEDIRIMQFTGEFDEAGKEIYEGDIVEEEVETEYGKTKITQEVTFNAGAFYPICMQPAITFKIIGNIYEK